MTQRQTKAVFIDYMGTTADKHSTEMAEIVHRICKGSNVRDPKQVQRFILDNRRHYEADSYLDGYLTEDEIVDRLIADTRTQIGLIEDPAALRDLICRHWVNAPVFLDAHTFFERCPYPIYNHYQQRHGLYETGLGAEWAAFRRSDMRGYDPPSLQAPPGNI